MKKRSATSPAGEIEYLRASGWVCSEHPLCTNWSGEGPVGGPLRPEPDLPIPVVWSDYCQALQMPYGMRPGQQERRAIYLVVVEEHQPRFGEWDIDYRFAAANVGPGSGSDREIRGGDWDDIVGYCRASHRAYASPGGRYHGLGFRLLKTE